MHVPTGLIATVTSGRSQQQNREAALRVLQGRLQAQVDQQGAQEMARMRGGGRTGRSGAVRTYDEVRDMVRCRNGQKIRGVAAVFSGALDQLL